MLNNCLPFSLRDTKQETTDMPFSHEDNIIIQHYRLVKKYSARELIKRFPNKNWTKGGLDKLLAKIEAWKAISQEQIDNTINRFRERVKKMLQVNGHRFEHLLKL